MTTIRPGEFWVAEIPCTDYGNTKKRPVLVLWLFGHDVIVAAVISAPPRTTTDFALAEWQESGLRVPSTVRLSRLDCLEQSLLLARLGHVCEADARRLNDIWKKQVKPQF